jgi:hypothetical protein
MSLSRVHGRVSINVARFFLSESLTVLQPQFVVAVCSIQEVFLSRKLFVTNSAEDAQQGSAQKEKENGIPNEKETGSSETEKEIKEKNGLS